MKWSAFRTGVRDIASTAVGVYMLIQQTSAPPERVNFFLIAFGAALLTVPGAIGTLSLFRGNGETPDTPQPPSRSRPRSSSRH